MSVVREKRPVGSGTGDDDGPIILHTYRGVGPRLPRPGDRALCGFIKKTESIRKRALPPGTTFQRCVVCEDLKGRR